MANRYTPFLQHVVKLGTAVVAAGSLLLAVTAMSCSSDGSDERVALAEPCETSVATLVAHMKEGTTDEQLSDLGEKVGGSGLRGWARSHADYDARTLHYDLCEDTSAADLAKLKEMLRESKVVARITED